MKKNTLFYSMIFAACLLIAAVSGGCSDDSSSDASKTSTSSGAVRQKVAPAPALTEPPLETINTQQKSQKPPFLSDEQSANTGRPDFIKGGNKPPALGGKPIPPAVPDFVKTAPAKE